MENVVVTGFGPFRNHPLNSSWEAMKDNKLRIGRPNVNLVTKQVSVSYEAADRVAGHLWLEYQPIMMVHVGVAALADSIRLEQIARHGPYLHDDVLQRAPHKHLRLVYEQDERAGRPQVEELSRKFGFSRTCFNLERVCAKLNQLHERREAPIAFKCSQDAGLYVCEYLYQASLRHSPRAVFIHVPAVGQFQLEDIQRSIELAIESLLDESNET